MTKNDMSPSTETALCVLLTVVSTAGTAAVGTCFGADCWAWCTTQPWGPKVITTEVQPRFRSSWAAPCASSTLVTEEPVSSSACVKTVKQQHCHILWLLVLSDITTAFFKYLLSLLTKTGTHYYNKNIL